MSKSSKPTPLKAIKKHCKECSNFELKEIRECPVLDCPLYPFRLGKNPYLFRKMTEEQRQGAAERLRKYREEV